MNPIAGGFKHLAKHHRELLSILEQSKDRPEVDFEWKVIKTTSPGHASLISKEIGLSCEEETIVFLMGGDGTSMEFCTGLMSLPLSKRNNLWLFRVPMGTGNDGLDANTFKESLVGLLHKEDHKELGTIKIDGPKLETQYAFNIGTVGLDAFVTHMTNIMKSRIPGNFYKIAVDLSTIFYDLFVSIRPMEISVKTLDGIKEIKDRFLFACMGVTGNRTYGNQMKILPDQNNFLAVNWGSILRRIMIKGAFYTGAHRNIKETNFYESEEITIQYDGRILLNRDGDTLWINKENFPLTMKIVPSGIRVLDIT